MVTEQGGSDPGFPEPGFFHKVLREHHKKVHPRRRVRGGPAAMTPRCVNSRTSASALAGIGRGRVHVAMRDGRGHGNPVDACDPEEGDPPEPDDPTTVLTVVADAAQETVTELLRQAGPVCGEHGIGVRPRPAGTAGGW
ncbi:hypothetical protein ACI2LJ_00575 [Streptomyces sp. NPDC088090]|uniref:hypothetical protein n=1 Tax=Streptomyces sp. NPDC088090 TaxID=3365822 RepID=UPI00384D5A74